MKKIVFFLILLSPFLAFADPPPVTSIIEAVSATEEPQPIPPDSVLPMVPIPTIESIEMPNEFTTIEGDVGHFFLYGPMIDSRPFVDALKFFVDLDIKRMAIEVHTSGGYARVMQRIVGYMDSYRGKIIFETRVYGIAMSAGFWVFIAGDERYMSKNTAYLLWHNPQPSKANPFLPPSPEEIQKTEMLKNLADKYVASRSDKITINRVRLEIEDNIWMISAEEAIELGLATGYIEDHVADPR